MRTTMTSPRFIAAAALLGLLAGAAITRADGATVKWTQPADCAEIKSWELLAAKLTAAKPDPKPADAGPALPVTLPAGTVCTNGTPLSAPVSWNGTRGTWRFWLRAVSADGVRSAESAPLEKQNPLAAPAGVNVDF